LQFLAELKAACRPTTIFGPMTTALGPKASTIQAILGYSKALQVVDAPPLGKVNLMLN